VFRLPQAAGLAIVRGCLFRTFIARPLEHGPSGKPEPAGSWDFSVASIEELAQAMEQA
jgi:hypothetical protein